MRLRIYDLREDAHLFESQEEILEEGVYDEEKWKKF